jgi:lambda family phage tail tape measure protein
MANNVGTVSIDLEARIAKLESDLGRAARIAEQRSREIQRTLAGIATAIGGAFSIGVVTEFVRHALDVQDEISKLSQKVGISTETLSGWRLAAQQAGVEGDGFNKAMVKLEQAATKAAAGNKAQVDQFKALGIAVTDAGGKIKPMEQLFGEVADRFAQFKDSATKTALATDLFGKSGAELIPLLNGGKAGLEEYVQMAKDFGLIVGKDAAPTAERFNDALEQLSFVGKGVANQLATVLGPVLADMAVKAATFFRGDQWKAVLDKIAAGAQAVVDNFEAIIDAVTRLGEIAAAVYVQNLLLNGARWITSLGGQLAALKALIVAQSEWGAATAASFKSATKEVGVLGVALKVLTAAFVGWEIGSYLRDQFLEVRLAGIALVDGLLTGWERIKQGALIAWEAVKAGAVGSFNTIRTMLADLAGSEADLLGKLPFQDGRVDQLRDVEKRLRPATSAADDFAAAVGRINAEAEKNIKAIHDNTAGLADYEIAAEAAKNKAAKPLPKVPTVDDRADLGAGFAAGVAKANTALEQFNKLVEEAFAKNMGSDDKLIDKRVEAIRKLAEEGGKAIAGGASVVEVQKKLSAAIDQTNQYYDRQISQAQKGINEYRAAMELRLATDKQALDLQVAGLGLSDRQIALERQLIDIHRESEAELAKLNDPSNRVQMTQQEYDQKLALIKQYEAARVQAAQDADAAVLAAEQDWSRGARRAMQNYADQAANVSSQTEQLVTGALNNWTDALVNFVTTGKLNFKSLASSILADLARMEARILMSQALMSIFGSFTGGGPSTGVALSGSGSYTGMGVASDIAGFTFNAKGGVYNSPSLSRYSGQVVSSPTVFAFAKGAGLMGEAGPEAILPLRRGSDGRLGVGAPAGTANGGIQINITVNADGSGEESESKGDDKEAGRRFAGLIRDNVLKVMADESRPGGFLWRQKANA